MNLKNTVFIVITALLLGVNGAAADKLKKNEWTVRLILKSQYDNLKDSYNKLGQRRAAQLGVDDYDLPELDQTWVGTYLSIIFYRPEWDSDRETFNTDFHPVTKKTSDEWTFEVRSDDPYRDLSLTWTGKQAKLKYMVLVDEEEEQMIPAVIDGERQVYHFRMNGTVREFTWKALTKKDFLALFESEENARVIAADTAEIEAATAGAALMSRTVSTPTRPKSNWLPRGWGQGETVNTSGEPIPVGLPDDPFAD